MRLLVLLVALALSASCAPEAPELRGRSFPPRDEAPQIRGVNWDGEPFALDVVAGKYTVVFFGFTFCPDICPLTLAKLRSVEQELGALSDLLEIVFVSVDPKRDSIEKLGQYVPRFDSSFYGVRVEADDLDATLASFLAGVSYGEPEDGPGGGEGFYLVDHTGTYYLLDPEGRIALTYPPDTTVEDLVHDLEVLLPGSSSAG